MKSDKETFSWFEIFNNVSILEESDKALTNEEITLKLKNLE